MKTKLFAVVAAFMLCLLQPIQAIEIKYGFYGSLDNVYKITFPQGTDGVRKVDIVKTANTFENYKQYGVVINGNDVLMHVIDKDWNVFGEYNYTMSGPDNVQFKFENADKSYGQGSCSAEQFVEHFYNYSLHSDMTTICTPKYKDGNIKSIKIENQFTGEKTNVKIKYSSYPYVKLRFNCMPFVLSEILDIKAGYFALWPCTNITTFDKLPETIEVNGVKYVFQYDMMSLLDPNQLFMEVKKVVSGKMAWRCSILISNE